MARIYDNIETKFAEGLQGIITNVGVKRVDFCVGYFNLRGWNLVVEQIDTLTGDYVYENDKRIFRKCRLLIGMHRPAEELIRQLYTEQVLPDANYVSQCKLEIARDFKRQLQLGLPTKQDEFTLRRLSAQMKDEKVCVKLYLREPLHAKLYLAHRPDDNFKQFRKSMEQNVIGDKQENVTDVTDRQHAIINLVKDHTNMTTTQMAERFGVTKRTILRDIKALKAKELIIRVGSEKTGYLELKQ